MKPFETKYQATVWIYEHATASLSVLLEDDTLSDPWVWTIWNIWDLVRQFGVAH